MRNFIIGLIVGTVMGSAVAASAAYIGKNRWEEDSGSSTSETFHLGYVAGVVDTVQALKKVSYFPRQSLAEGLDRINQCTDNLTLGQAVERAETANSQTQSSDNMADVILGAFLKCP